MAAYPTLPMRTRVRVLNDRQAEFSESGAVRMQDFGAVRIYEISVDHPLITTSEASTLRSFYESNRLVSLTITAGDGYTYTVYFKNEPDFEIVNSARVNGKSMLTGTRN